MKIKLKYLYYKIRKRITKNKMKDLTLFGQKICLEDEGSNQIKKMIESDKPCLIARIGSSEMQAINSTLEVKLKIKKSLNQLVKFTLCNNAGFFPSDDLAVQKFTDLYIKIAKDIDFISILGNNDEDFYLDEYCRNPIVAPLRCLEPYYFNNPWSEALKSKNVLIISPFTQSIQNQYSIRELIFKEKNVLPEFNLKTLTSVQTIGENTCGYDNWFDALDDMKSQVLKVDFDIAIIGCGSYSLPLAGFIKEMGKTSIVMGGATQILFGIKGQRWDNHSEISKLFNENWVRPMTSEVPNQYENVENGCYW